MKPFDQLLSKLSEPEAVSVTGLRPCPFCGSVDLSIVEAPEPSFVLCETCGCSGPIGETMEQIRSAWQRRAGDGV